MENNNKEVQISWYVIVISMIAITGIIIFAFSGPLETSSNQVYEKTETSESTK